MNADEIVRALRTCAGVKTGDLCPTDCPKHDICEDDGDETLKLDAADLIESLNAQPNDPLTLEELRGMDRDIVWLEPMKEYRTVLLDVNLPEDVRLWTPFGAISAKHIIANDGRIYRRKPERSEGNDLRGKP